MDSGVLLPSEAPTIAAVSVAAGKSMSRKMSSDAGGVDTDEDVFHRNHGARMFSGMKATCVEIDDATSLQPPRWRCRRTLASHATGSDAGLAQTVDCRVAQRRIRSATRRRWATLLEQRLASGEDPGTGGQHQWNTTSGGRSRRHCSSSTRGGRDRTGRQRRFVACRWPLRTTSAVIDPGRADCRRAGAFS